MNSYQPSKSCLAVLAAIAILAFCSVPAQAQRSVGVGSHTLKPSESAQNTTADPAPRPTPPPTSQVVPQKPTIADFAWLEGRWQGTWGPRVAEQCWSSPKAGMMLGTFRLVENERTLVLELFTLMEKPDGINLYFRHFTPELVPWEKFDATTLSLVTLDSRHMTFENSVNGQPKHSTFVRVDPDTFVSRSEIVPDSGETQIIEITYHRQKPVAAAASASKSSGGNAARR